LRAQLRVRRTLEAVDVVRGRELAALPLEGRIGREVDARLDADRVSAAAIRDLGHRRGRARLELDRPREVVVLEERIVDVVAERAGEFVRLAHAIEAPFRVRVRHPQDLARISRLGGRDREDDAEREAAH
jgi:hypothetical protein